MEKNELIANLYGLRAGLSVISVEKDTVDERQRAIDDVEGKIHNEQKTINQHKNRISEYESEISDIETKREDAIEERNQEYKKSKKDAWQGCGFALFFALIVAVALAFAASFIMDKFTNKSDAEGNRIAIIVAAIGAAIVFCGGLLWDIISFISYKKLLNRRLMSATSECDKKLTNCQKAIESEKHNILVSTNNIKQYEKDLINVKSSYDKIAVPAILRSKDMQSTLETNYMSVIMQSDWENIDMVIYYLSTGRADDLKEALQLYDRQKQTDDIVGAIKQAEYTIANEIRSGMRALGKAMIQCFDRLSNQLTKQHLETITMLGSINQSIQENTAAITAMETTQIISNEKLRRSLTEKIDSSSKKLVSDMKSMKKKIVELNHK